jgi:phosphatidate cytidylyltransferase
MTPKERLFDATQAFDHPATVAVVVAIAVGLVAASILVRALRKAGRINDATYHELLARTRSWYVLSAAMVLPVLLGAAWVCGCFLLLSLFCFREYARATGVWAWRSAVWPVVVATLVTDFAALDHWMGLFTTSWALGTGLVAVAGLLPDDPPGYLRRVSLAILGFALFGVSLGHLAFMSNDALFRPLLLWLLLCVELNDVFAYLTGKTFGRRKLLPHTSPNKTIAGAVGAVVLTTLLATTLGHFVFAGTNLDQPVHLVTLGLLISVMGQCGDLVVSSIKRDLGLKDMSALIPGHGGLLDRFDSLLFVAPCVFHYVNFFKTTGIAWDQPARIITGSL